MPPRREERGRNPNKSPVLNQHANRYVAQLEGALQGRNRYGLDPYQDLIKETPGQRVLPLFRRENWVNTSDNVYKTIYPAIILASRLVSHPFLGNFFLDMARQYRDLTRAAHLDAITGIGPDLGGTRLLRANLWRNPTPLTQLSLRNELDEVGACLKWDWEDAPTDTTAFPDVLGETLMDDDGLLTIRINKWMMDFWIESSRVSPAAYFMWLVIFAVLLVHELAHAVWKYQDPENTYLDEDGCLMPAIIEPFYGDFAFRELGTSWEGATYGGYNLLTQTVTDVYGRYIYLWSSSGVPLDTERVRRRRPRLFMTHYLVPVDTIYELVSETWWNNLGYRSNRLAFRFPKRVGMRYWQENPDNIGGNVPPSSASSAEYSSDDAGIIRRREANIPNLYT